MATVLGNALDFLKELGVYDVLLPFILVFTIMFAILERTKLFDNDLKVSYRDQTLEVTHDVEDYFNLKNDSEKKVIKLKVAGYNNSYIAKELKMHPNKVASVINKVAERYKSNNE